MPGGIKIGRVFGIPVRVDWTWFIALLVIGGGLGSQFARVEGPLGARREVYWLMGLTTALLLFASVLAHELSHALVAQSRGVPIEGITLFLFGGVAEMAQEPESPKQELLLAAAGPVMSGVLAGVFYTATAVAARLGWPAAVVIVLKYVGLLNLVLVAFNIVPGFPLDGGRVLRAILWHVTRNLRRATYISTRIGVGVAILLMAYGVLLLLGRTWSGLWFVFIGFFLKEAAESGYEHVLLKRALAGMQVGQVMSAPVVTVPTALPLDVLVDDYFLRRRFKGFPVEEGGRIVGLVSLGDVKAVPREHWPETAVGQVMQTDVLEHCVSPKDEVGAALAAMVEHGLGRIPVCLHDQPIGMISRRDIMELFRIRTDLVG